MATQMWTAPVGLFPGTSVANATFTSARNLPVGESGASNGTDAGGLCYIPGNALVPGSRLEIEAWGVASNTGTPTLIMGVYWGGVAGTALAVSTAKTTTTAMSNWEWHLTYQVRVLTTGVSGSMIGSGYWRLPTSLTAWTEIRLPETAPAAVTSLDTTVQKLITVGATWSASSASNTISCHDMRVQIDG